MSKGGYLSCYPKEPLSIMLVDGLQEAGTYAVTWDAADMASGLYVYRLEVGSTVLTGKMTLLR